MSDAYPPFTGETGTVNTSTNVVTLDDTTPVRDLRLFSAAVTAGSLVDGQTVRVLVKESASKWAVWVATYATATDTLTRTTELSTVGAAIGAGTNVEVEVTLPGAEIPETDPVFLAAPAAGIASGDITNWDTAHGWGDHASAGYLTTETDPVVGAINGIVKADGAGNISAATADTDYLTPGTASSTYLPLTGGTLTGALIIDGGSGADNYIAVGYNAAVTNDGTAAIGENAESSAQNAIAIGRAATAPAQNSLAIGQSSNAADPACVAIGSLAEAFGNTSVAIGGSASSTDSVAIGSGANSEVLGVAIGREAENLTSSFSWTAVALGDYAVVQSGLSMAIGPHAKANGSPSNFWCNAIGSGVRALHQNCVAIGTGYEDTTAGTHAGVATTADNQIVIGLGSGFPITAGSNLLVANMNASSPYNWTSTWSDDLTITGDLQIDGDVGFYGTSPVAQATGYTTFSNLTTDRTCDANSTTVAELADILGTLIEDLKATGIIGA